MPRSAKRTPREAELEAEVERLRAELGKAGFRDAIMAQRRASEDLRHATELAAVLTSAASDATAQGTRLAESRAYLASSEALGRELRRANAALAAGQEALRESEARLRAVFDQQFQFMAILSPDGTTLDINDLPLRAAGIDRDRVIGKPFWETPFWADLPDMREAWPGRLEAAAHADVPVLSEDLYQAAGGAVRVADAAITAVKGADGEVQMFLIQASDITERKRAEAAQREEARRRELLIAELNHRAKNMLSTVQSLAAQTLKGVGGDPMRFATHFSARLRTLARAHDLLTAHDWGPTDLAVLARAALAPWLENGRGPRISIAGDPVMVTPQQAQALVLALHELATNATKYGALSRSGGQVRIRHTVDEGGAASVAWEESGGPAVPGPPARRGFGTRLLERGLARDLGPGSSVALRFEPGGLRAEIRFRPRASEAAA